MLSFIAAFEHGGFKDVVSFGTSTWSKFVIAAYNGDEKTLEAILKTNFSDINRQNKWGMTALHFVACRGHLSCLLLLLEQPEINLYIANKEGWLAKDILCSDCPEKTWLRLKMTKHFRLRSRRFDQVTRSPRSLMKEMLNIQGIHVDPYNIEAAIPAILQAMKQMDSEEKLDKHEVFLCYRSSTEKILAQALQIALQSRGVLNIFLDLKSFVPGLPWKKQLVKGLAESRFFLPLISSAGLAQVRDPTVDHRSDSLLLEYEAALFLRETIPSFIIPLFVGSHADDGGYKHFSDFKECLYSDSLTP